jgi:hypothetical protein
MNITAFLCRNKFYIVHQSREIEQRMIDSNRVNTKKCTGDKLTKILGLELCGEVSYPTTPDMSDVPAFPMTGPAKMSVVLNKKDTHTSYDFEAILKTTKVCGVWGRLRHSVVCVMPHKCRFQPGRMLLSIFYVKR